MIFSHYSKVCFLIIRQRLSAILEYRANFSLRIVAGFLGFIFLVTVWKGFRPQEFANEIWFFYVLAGLVGGFNAESFYRTMAGDINSGNLSFALSQPFPYFLRLSSRVLADGIVNVGIMISVILISYLFLQGNVNISPINVLYSVVFLLIGRIVSLLLSFLFGCISFLWINPDALYLALDNLLFMLYGSLVPFWLIPKQWKTIVDLFPFRSVVASPVEVMLGKSENLLQITLVSLVWVMFLSFISKKIWQKVLIYYEAVGG